ncbi:hypothetical protein GTP58_14575 [Duganella sp. CY15W]|uniref:hypothetical protein n=1 Tax=Duganella sp. CY15W TaxID=2692172 RepID=UPI0013704DAA|nr:hypothetical protein [Duganella sp. CY15W]MYM29552.1 hypothetical protein [Duganella sp. CY15W]
MNPTPPFYCIAHAPFNWKMPDFMTMVGSGDYVPEKGLAMSQLLSPEEAMRNRYLGEYLALFEIRRRLIAEKAEGFVGFCHYRRFALTDPIGILHQFNYHAHPDMLAKVKPEHFYGDGKTPIVPISVGWAGTVLQQYEACVTGRDILMFFGDAIDCGVISNLEAANFLSGKAFIPAPTVAFIPVQWFVEIIHDLELVASRYFRHHYVYREGYADRSIAFCCERLQAFLLSKRIAEWGQDKVIQRPLVLLGENYPNL